MNEQDFINRLIDLLGPIRIPELPDVEPLPDGTSKRVWLFVFEEAPQVSRPLAVLASEIETDTIKVLQSLFEDRHPGWQRRLGTQDWSIDFEFSTPVSLIATTTESDLVRSDEFLIFAPVWMTMLVAEIFGPIRTIMGQPRDEHFIWKYRRMFFLGLDVPEK